MSDGRRDNGDAGQHAPLTPLRAANVEEYRAKLEDLDHAWATLTDVERLELEADTKRRRADNPNWPFLNSDHADRLIDRIGKNSKAVHALEDAISGPDGMALRMRASTSAIDMMRDELARHGEKMEANTLAQDSLRASIDRLIAAWGAVVIA